MVERLVLSFQRSALNLTQRLTVGAVESKEVEALQLEGWLGRVDKGKLRAVPLQLRRECEATRRRRCQLL